MGAFTQEKGQEFAVEAMRLLESRAPDVRCVLAGDGKARKQLQESSPSTVSFPGFLADKAAFFASLDLFLMPSLSEAWGLAALEAMSYGVPVIASDVGGLREIVKHHQSGWLIPSGDAQALAEAILSARQHKLSDFSQAARRRAAEFTVDHMAKQTEELYYQVLDEDRSWFRHVLERLFGRD